MISEKIDGIINYLPQEVVEVGQIVRDVFLAGSTINTFACQCKDNIPPNPGRSRGLTYDFYIFEPHLYAQMPVHAKTHLAQAIFDTSQISYRNGIEYYQASGDKSGVKINVTWTIVRLSEFLISSPQCLYHIFSRTLSWQNYDLHSQRLLHTPELESLIQFQTLAAAHEPQFVQWYQRRLNFVFKLYMKHLEEGWSLSPIDRDILASYFRVPGWRLFLNEMFSNELRKKGRLLAAVELVDSLRLKLAPPALPAPAEVPKTDLVTDAIPIPVEESISIADEVPAPKPAPEISAHYQNEDEEIVVKGKFAAKQQWLQSNQKILDAINAHQSWLEKEKQPPSPPAPTKSTSLSPPQPKRRIKQVVIAEKAKVARPPKVETPKNPLVTWVSENPLLFLTGLFTLGVGFVGLMMQLLRTKESEPTVIETCSDHYVPVMGNSNLTSATLLIMMYQGYNSPNMSYCLTEFFGNDLYKTLLVEDEPLGKEVPCSHGKCFGWDDISPRRSYELRRYILEYDAFTRVQNIYQAHKNDRMRFQQNLEISQNRLIKNRKKMEKDHFLTPQIVEENKYNTYGTPLDEYRNILISLRHLQFLLREKPIVETKELFEQYVKEFSPSNFGYVIDTEKELKNRLASLRKAIKRYVSTDLKVALFVNQRVFLPYYAKLWREEISHVVLTDRKGD